MNDRHSDTLTPIGEHEIRIGELATPIRLRILRRSSDGALIVRQSHFLKTAIQYLPYSVSNASHLGESELIAELTTTLNGFYDQAIRRGYKPDENWLFENVSFNK